MLERFKRTGLFRKAVEDERELLEDIIIDNTQAIEMASIYSNILSGLMDAFASVIANNMSTVMNTLTKITIVLMLPTLLASLYGMNVPLPFSEDPDAFWFIMVTSVMLILGGFAIFRNNRF
jgi:magnesium transporter